MDGVAARRKWTACRDARSRDLAAGRHGFRVSACKCGACAAAVRCWSSPSVAASVWPAENGPLQPVSLQPRSPVSVPVCGVGAESAKQGFDRRIVDVAVGGVTSAGTGGIHPQRGECITTCQPLA